MIFYKLREGINIGTAFGTFKSFPVLMDLRNRFGANRAKSYFVVWIMKDIGIGLKDRLGGDLKLREPLRLVCVTNF